jgi:hypothetical protein
MAAGSDKRISYDPPGAIGLVDQEAVFTIRFNETDSSTKPQDDGLVCNDFDTTLVGNTAMPALVPAAVGRGRLFDGATTGIGARDRVSGATLLTRDMSIQAILSWDAAGQLAAAVPGNIISRGLGTSPAEYIGYRLRLDVVSAPTFTGLLRWAWMDIGGTEHLQAGAQVTITPGQFTMLTATRRWVSPTQVELRYYVGDQLIGSVTSADGSIGGGTTGAIQIGYRSTAGVNSNWYAGIIDEIQIVDRELVLEEIEATWLRITRYQVLGTQLFLENHDQGFPMSTDPGSDVQLDTRMVGQSLGFAAAHIEDLRANFLPTRAYGRNLELWEQLVRPVVGGSPDVQARRDRVVARLRQRRGVSIPGLQDALVDLVDADVNALEFLAFDNRWSDAFNTISSLRWDLTPASASLATPTATAGSARFAPGAGSFTMQGDEGVWLAIAAGVSRSSELSTNQGEHALAKMTMTTPQSGLESGVWFGNRATSSYVLLGLRDTAGSFQVVTESFVGRVSQGLVVRDTLAGNPAAIWLHLYNTGTSWQAAWSIVSRTSGYATSATFAGPNQVHWSGCYLRSIGAIGAPVVNFDDFTLWTPNGSRSLVAYVYRNPALGGAPDIEGSQSVIRAIKHSFTEGGIITSKTFRLAVDGCDRVPMGALQSDAV